MKTKYAALIVALGISSMALAQENDDMYFNAKDRVVANRANEVVLAKRYAQEDQTAIKTNPVNPSDSYTGRGVNPEYSSQIKNGTALVQNNPDYFLSNYTPKDINTSLSNGSNSSYYGNNAYSNMCGCNSAFSNYGMGYGMNSMYGMGGMYGMNSMYGMGGYGMNSMYGMGYGYPYGGGSYSSMMLGFGPGFGGMGMGMGYGMGSMYSPYGMYSPYYGYGYPTVVVNNDARVTTHGRRSVRSSDTNANYVGNTRNGNAVTSNGRSVQGGRVSSGSPDYYNRGWRNDPNVTSRSFYDNNTGNFNRGGYTNGGNNGGMDNSGTRTRSAWDSGFGSGNSNSGARTSFGGGGGFSGGGGGGGGGGGHSRGR